MKHTQEVQCPYCESSALHKNGHSENGTQRCRCIHCRKSFQLTYSYNARKPDVKRTNCRINIEQFKRLNRRTICYSKSEEVHDNVIGMYIERYYFKTGLFRNTA